MQVLGILAEPRTRVMPYERPSLHLDHLAQPQRTRLAAERRAGNESLARDDAVDQSRDLRREGQAGVAGLPLLHHFAPREAEAPDDSRFEREPRIVIPRCSRSRSIVS